MYVISPRNISCPVDCYVSEKWTWGPAGLDCTLDPCNFFSYDHRKDHCQSLFKEVKMLNLTRYNNKTIMISCSHTGIPLMKSSTLKGFPPLLFPPPPVKKDPKWIGWWNLLLWLWTCLVTRTFKKWALGHLIKQIQ